MGRRTTIGAATAAAMVCLTVAAGSSAVARDLPLLDYDGFEVTTQPWAPVTIQGQSTGLSPGTPLCLYRVELGDTDADGTRLNICTRVNRDGTFRMTARLGRTGDYFYHLLPTPNRTINQRGLVISVTS